MLRFNTFRAQRYLRSTFVEGKYLLASEASDLELEVLDLLRETVKSTLGDVAIEDAWKVEKLSDTQILIKPGEAWFRGLPFAMRSGKDQQVSGASLSLGIVPAGVIATDDSTGLGKIITFNSGSTTPTDLYRLVITAREERITDVDDPFLKNANLIESTAQKIRLNFKLNIVSESDQTESPLPYTNDTTQENLVNQIVVSPVALQNGSLVSLNVLSGSENIDGRDLELIIRNDSGMGGGNPIPNGNTDQQAFYNGTLVDSLGCEYHINAIFNDTVSTQVVIRIDKEPGQPNPQIVNGSPYTLIKRDVYVSDDINGSPQGKLFWPIATLDWNSTDGIVHPSKITDLRTSVKASKDFQENVNNKFDLFLVDGGNINWDLTNSLLTSSASFKLLNPHGAVQTIATLSTVLVDGGCLSYLMDIAGGGAIERGNLSVTIASAGATSTLSGSPDLSQVRVGNIIKDFNGVISYITDIDDVNDSITTNAALTGTGVATIYLDSFAPTYAPKSSDSFILAVRNSSKIYIGIGDLELEDGETSQLGDGISSELLTYIGASGESDDAPQYSTNHYVNDGDSLTTAIGKLDTAVDAVAAIVAANTWKAPVADYASLPSMGNNDGDVRLTLDTRIVYSWVNTSSTWVPISGSGGLVKVDFLDPISTTLPTGASVTIDGVSGVDGDLVLYTNLSSGNNKVYLLGGVGVSITWTSQLVFNGSEDPSTSDAVIVRKGNSFSQQVAIFDGTLFKVNDVVRYFDGVSADFWEQSSIKTTTLNDNSTGNIFSVAFSGSENMIIKYSLLRGSVKETGELYLTTDGSNVALTRTNAYIGSSGVTFTAQISGSDLELNYQTTNLSTDATFKYSVGRWSDASGGPTGIPSYTGGGGGGFPAAGINTDVQYNNGGTLAGDSRFQWDATAGAVDLNGFQQSVLSSAIMLNDNQVSPINAFTYDAATYRYVVIEYSVVRDTDYRTGRMLISNNGTAVGFDDSYVETGPTAITFSAVVSGSDVQVKYTSTSSGFDGSLKYSMRRWN